MAIDSASAANHNAFCIRPSRLITAQYDLNKAYELNCISILLCQVCSFHFASAFSRAGNNVPCFYYTAGLCFLPVHPLQQNDKGQIV